MVDNPGLVNPSYQVLKHSSEPIHPSISLIHKHHRNLSQKFKPLVPSLFSQFFCVLVAFFRGFFLSCFFLFHGQRHLFIKIHRQFSISTQKNDNSTLYFQWCDLNNQACIPPLNSTWFVTNWAKLLLFKLFFYFWKQNKHGKHLFKKVKLYPNI